MNLVDIPLKDIEALLGEKDLIIYVLERQLVTASKVNAELEEKLKRKKKGEPNG